MRVPFACAIAATVLVAAAPRRAAAQEGAGLVGKRVVLKQGDGGRRIFPRVARTQTRFRVYRVVKAEGPKLLLEAGAASRWCPAEDVVPFDDAFAFYTDEIRRKPTALAHRQRGLIRHERGEYDPAIADFTEAIRLDATDGVAYFHRGSAWKAKGDLDKALADFGRAMEIGPPYPEAANAYGLILLTRKDPIGAGNLFSHAIGSDPDFAEAYRNRADSRATDIRQALADYTDAIRLDRYDVLAYRGRGALLLDERKFDEAKTDLSEAIRLDPKDGVAFRTRGVVRQIRGDFDGALADFSEAIRLDPKDALAHYHRGHTRSIRAEFDKARADWAEADRLAPGRTWSKDAEVYVKSDEAEYDDQMARFTEQIRLKPADSRSYSGRGSNWLAKGRHDRAMADYNEAIHLHPGNHSAYANRGVIRQLKGDFREALADFDVAVRLDPKSSFSYFGRGTAQQSLKEFDKAAADYSEAIRLDPMPGWLHVARGNLWAEKKELEKALADYDLAIRISPRDVDAFCCRGIAWQAKKEYGKALVDFDEATRLDPLAGGAYERKAWVMATCPDPKHRNGKRAVEAATRACDLISWKDGRGLETLAAAYAESGDFDAAVRWQSKAVDILAKEEAEVVASSKARLASYREKTPWREP